MLLLLLACADLSLPTLPEQTPGADHLLVLVHGGGDGPNGWPAEFAEVAAQGLREPERWDILLYDWSEDAEGGVNVTRRAQRHGRWLGERLGEDYAYAHLHLVGHSAGSFVVYGVTDTLGPGRVETIHETYLDPFGGVGLVRWGYGRRRFGEGADFAEAYMNTEDGVPSTNRPFPGMYTFDLSGLADDALEPKAGHRFPIGWYQDSVETPDEARGWALSAEWTGEAPTQDALNLERGGVEAVEAVE